MVRLQIQASADAGAQVVELHTGAYCDAARQSFERMADWLRGVQESSGTVHHGRHVIG